MTTDRYDIRILGSPLQAIHTVGSLSAHYDRERDADFSDTRLARKLGTIAHGELLIAQECVSSISLSETSDGVAELIHLPELGKTRHESRLAVAFGQLIIKQMDREHVAELVAVKYTSSFRAAREYAATQVVKKRIGDGHTFTPIGFLKHTKPMRDSTGLLTRYRHEVLTLDGIFWNDEATQAQRLTGVAHAASWLATLHNHDISHGDAEPKNIAHSSNETPVYVDLETAHDLRDPRIFRLAHELEDVSDFIRYQSQSLSSDELEIFIDTYLSSRDTNTISPMMIAEIHEKPLMPIHHFDSIA